MEPEITGQNTDQGSSPSAPQQPEVVTPVNTQPLADVQPQVNPTAPVQPAAAQPAPVIPQAPPQVAAMQPPVTLQNQPQLSPLGGAKSNSKKKIGIIVAALLILGLLAGGVFLATTMLGGDKDKISSSDLILEEQEKMSFLRPSQWFEVDEIGVDYAFSEEALEDGAPTGKGTRVKDAKNAMIAQAQTVGELDAEELQTVKETIKTQLADKDTLFDGDQCEEVTGYTNEEIQADGFDVLFSIEATCDNSGSTERQSSTVKLRMGIGGGSLVVFGVQATTDLWDLNGSVYDEMISSIKPVAQ